MAEESNREEAGRTYTDAQILVFGDEFRKVRTHLGGTFGPGYTRGDLVLLHFVWTSDELRRSATTCALESVCDMPHPTVLRRLRVVMTRGWVTTDLHGHRRTWRMTEDGRNQVRDAMSILMRHYLSGLRAAGLV
ncbi:MAG: hypothetical protein GY791_17760 [Alphaproteobacteria bacterium]|nr:hypothetical protein [Alphaproteobacteria bacterium]